MFGETGETLDRYPPQGKLTMSREHVSYVVGVSVCTYSASGLSFNLTRYWTQPFLLEAETVMS